MKAEEFYIGQKFLTKNDDDGKWYKCKLIKIEKEEYYLENTDFNSEWYGLVWDVSIEDLRDKKQFKQ